MVAHGGGEIQNGPAAARGTGAGRSGGAVPGRRIPTGVLLALALVVLVTVAGCAAGPNNVATMGSRHLAGFWPGLWHGLISPITFLVSLFNHHVSVYEVHNNGGWYDFGFMLGVSMVFGGGPGSAGRRRRSVDGRG